MRRMSQLHMLHVCIGGPFPSMQTVEIWMRPVDGLMVSFEHLELKSGFLDRQYASRCSVLPAIIHPAVVPLSPGAPLAPLGVGWINIRSRLNKWRWNVVSSSWRRRCPCRRTLSITGRPSRTITSRLQVNQRYSGDGEAVFLVFLCPPALGNCHSAVFLYCFKVKPGWLCGSKQTDHKHFHVALETRVGSILFGIVETYLTFVSWLTFTVSFLFRPVNFNYIFILNQRLKNKSIQRLSGNYLQKKTKMSR